MIYRLSIPQLHTYDVTSCEKPYQSQPYKVLGLQKCLWATRAMIHPSYTILDLMFII